MGFEACQGEEKMTGGAEAEKTESPIELQIQKIDELKINNECVDFKDDKVSWKTPILDRARSKFAISAQHGLDFLIKRNMLDDIPSEIAQFLLYCRFLDGRQVGLYLADESNEKVLKCYLAQLKLADMPVQEALRKFACGFQLPGEAQQIDRLMRSFAQSYRAENLQLGMDEETVYVLAFAIVLLNTDLHSPNNPRRMEREEFVRNVQTTLQGTSNSTTTIMEDAQLASIYDIIAKQELTAPGEGKDVLLEYALSAPDIEGILWKKSDRATFHSWHRRWCVVVNGCLYYFRGRKDHHPRGVIPLEDLLVYPINKKGKFRFFITNDFKASDADTTDAYGDVDDDDNNNNCYDNDEEDGLASNHTTIFSLAASTIRTISSLFEFENIPMFEGGSSIRSMTSENVCFVKSAKFVRGRLVEGRRSHFLFQCSTEEERDRWVSVLRVKMQTKRQNGLSDQQPRPEDPINRLEFCQGNEDKQLVYHPSIDNQKDPKQRSGPTAQ